MFLRMVAHTIRDDDALRMAKTYERLVLSALKSTPGCAFAALIQNIDKHTECISLTLWKSHEESLAYEASGLYLQLVNALRPFFLESTAWKLQLNEEYALENTLVQIEPDVAGYSESVAGPEEIHRLKEKPFAVQILSLSVQEDQMRSFERIFSDEIHQKYKLSKGFIDLILLRQNREYHSISFWDETADIQSSSEVHSINQLVKSIYSLLPSFIQWRVSRSGAPPLSASSEDIKAAVYRCLVAEWFAS
jgi:heme-degrading monooxygenase HmoA